MTSDISSALQVCIDDNVLYKLTHTVITVGPSTCRIYSFFMLLSSVRVLNCFLGMSVFLSVHINQLYDGVKFETQLTSRLDHVLGSL